jgi:hypothetical protein
MPCNEIKYDSFVENSILIILLNTSNKFLLSTHTALFIRSKKHIPSTTKHKKFLLVESGIRKNTTTKPRGKQTEGK